ncbi:MAG: hypothetical protein ACRDT4_10550 [Micromonosporaceae bacterium]
MDAPVSSAARGIGARPAARGFLTSSALRLAEALFRPPSRAATAVSGPVDTPAPARGNDSGPARSNDSAPARGDAPTPAHHVSAPVRPGAPAPGRGGDALSLVGMCRGRVGSSALVAATARAVRDWNAEHGVPSPRVVAALGASRRPGTALAPDRRTAFFRLRVPAGADAGTVRRLLAETAPEPDFPETHGGPLRPVIRALSSRLGATVLVSHLGPVTLPAAATSLAFYPTATGRSGIAVGAATCGEITTVTVRARRPAFDESAANDLVARITATLP